MKNAGASPSRRDRRPPPGRVAPRLPLGRVIHGDNLDLISRLPAGCADFIYMDPPYLTGRNRSHSHRSRARGFPDVWNGGMQEYLEFLRPRLEGTRRLLNPAASICLHLDWHAVHYVKVLMDRLFGTDNFLNEIIWSYRTGGTSPRWFPRKHDTLLVYAKQAGQHTFHPLRAGHYRTDGLNVDSRGRPYKRTRKGPLYFDARGPQVTDVWDIPFLSTVSVERAGYPTQKPIALMRRLLEAFTDPRDLVMDLFCGSGTTLVAAKQLNRKWLGCDCAEEAVRIARKRIRAAAKQPTAGLTK